MRVYSQSQGKVIDIPTTPVITGGKVGGGLVGGTDKLRLRQILGLGALARKQYGTAGQLLLPSEQEVSKAEAKKKAEELITTLEDFYFKNKLHYGPVKGIIKGLLAKIDPNQPLAIYNRFARSKGVTLAKAAGDVGNIAFVEQMAQLRGLAAGRQTRKSAETQFKLLRKGFGLPERDYSKLGESGLEELMKKYKE